MCGITGWVDFKKQLVQEKQTMDRMTDTLSKRGPDDSNVWGSTMFYSDIKDLRLLILKADASRWRVPIKAIRTPLFTMASFITRKICAKNCGRGAINSSVRQIPRCFCTATSSGRKTVSTISMAYSLSLCGMKSVICCLPRETVSV